MPLLHLFKAPVELKQSGCRPKWQKQHSGLQIFKKLQARFEKKRFRPANPV
jgi:hypothetical protein